jgi:hypothetical protein
LSETATKKGRGDSLSKRALRINFTNQSTSEITKTERGINTTEEQLHITIPRSVAVALYHFTDYFKGFEKVEAVKRIFGEDTEKALSELMVEFAGWRGYMGVSDNDGHLIASASYLCTGDVTDIYLDIIHELVHVRQFREGKELFDSDYTYIERPTEIEAYGFAVQEARRLALSDERICEYLKPEWMSDKDLKRLAETMNVKCADSTKTIGKRTRRR